MNNVVLSKRADRDLRDIYLFGISNFGAAQADKYRGELDDTLALLADTPRMGRFASQLGEGVRRHEHGSHVILYRERRGGILVLGVVHGRSHHRFRALRR